MSRPKGKCHKKDSQEQEDPLCLFYHPRPQVIDHVNNGRESYLSSTRGLEPSKTQKLAQVPWRGSKARAGAAAAVQRALSSSDETSGRKTRSRRACDKSVTRRYSKAGCGKRKVRRFGKEPVRHLASYLLTAGAGRSEKGLPELNRVLDTLTDAWPSSKHLTLDSTVSIPHAVKSVKPTPVEPPLPPRIMERRRSVPEEIIRKFSVSNERTSESETNITMPEVSSTPSSKEDPKERKSEELSGYDKLSSTAFSKKVEDDGFWPPVWQGRTGQSFHLIDEPDTVRSAEEGSSDSDSDAPGMQRFNTIKRAPLRRGSIVETSTIESSDLPSLGLERASQRDYNRNGHGILKIGAAEKSSQTGECTCRVVAEDSGTTPTARDEESDSGDSSESISSPRCCGQRLSSSDNQSSDSEDILCTCLEMSSKETSTDPYHSGKSTLSQTVSDKTTSTQDSTASINSVSSRGSTITAATDSSSTELDPRTSAKETTTSPDHTPRSPPFRKHNGDRSGGGGKGGGGGRNERGHSHNCPHHHHRGTQSQSQPRRNNNNRNNYSRKEHTSTNANKEGNKSLKSASSRKVQTCSTTNTYEWAQLSREELHMIQGEREKRFVENNLWNPLTYGKSVVPGKINVCTSSGTTYHSTENLTSLPMMVPRYSALPRSMSMMVNASSLEMNQHSDSESLADSLEDGHNRRDPKPFDTKQELKPVRGDVRGAPRENPQRSKQKQPKGKAYFFAIDESGSAELVTDIHKIPDLPEPIKKRIHKRHVSICKNHEKTENPIKVPKEMKSKKKRRERLVRKQKPSSTSKSKAAVVDDSPRLVSKEIHKDDDEKVGGSSNNKRTGKSEQIQSEVSQKLETAKGRTKKTGAATDRTVGSQMELGSSRSLQRTKDVTLKTEPETKVTPRKPQAVIHPSPIPSAPHPDEQPTPTVDISSSKDDPRAEAAMNRQALIASLESAAAALKQQIQQKQQNRSQPVKRPVKFQQRFEVIPEERSSSLSSAEDPKSEKNRRRSLPVKLTENATSPNFLTPDGGKFRRYSLGSLSNYVIAKLMGRPLQAIPCVQRGPNNEDQQIIIFSPKDPGANNSAKGRDALLAMNREDFNRLSKGWMNFYLLKESSDSETEKNTEENLGKTEEETNENNLGKELNTIVCRIPSMERDPPTTSGSGTDETCVSPGRSSQSMLNKSYLLRNAESNRFQLEECVEPDGVKNIPDNDYDTRSSLNVIIEEADTLVKETNSYSVYEDRKENVSPKETCIPVAKLTNRAIPKLETSKQQEKPKEEPTKKLTKEASTSTEKKEPRLKRESSIKLSAPLKLGSSNTVLTTKKPIKVSPRGTPKSNRTFSLPELRVEEQRRKPQAPVKTYSLVDSLPQVAGASTESDSDSTIYMKAPSPDIPPLILEDCCDCCSDSSSSSDDARIIAEKCNLEKQYVPLRRKPQPFRPKNRFAYRESSHGKRPGWSVTVEGTLAFPRTRPDVQMRLSFPAGVNVDPPIVSQSDSGFVEDRDAKLSSAVQKNQQWTVTVQNPQTGKEKQKSVCRLPSVSQRKMERSTERQRGSKEGGLSTRRLEIESKLEKIWPKVQAVLENELKAVRIENLVTDEQDAQEPLLSVEGRAMSFDTKPRVPKMSERDLTRNNTARSGLNSVATSQRLTKKN